MRSSSAPTSTAASSAAPISYVRIADFENADVTSTRLIGLRGRDQARNLDRVRNLDCDLND